MATKTKKTKTAKKTVKKAVKKTAKKTVKKKVTAKASARKKPIKKKAKKAAPKKSTPKKPASKKRAVKKKVVKKVAAKKKTTTKKIIKKSTKKPVKKKAAKKTVAKKASTKKVSAKKTTAKKTKTNLSKKIQVVKKSSKKSTAKNKKADALKIETKASSSTKVKKTTSQTPSPTKGDLRTFRKMAKESKKRLKAKLKAAKPTKNFIAKPPSKGKTYSLDLRVHSPGTVGYFSAGGVEPGPALVRLAQVKGLDIVGLTDYYNPTYIDEVQAASQDSKMTIVPGMDMRCKIGDCEEVYITALFPEEYGSEDLEKVLKELNVPDSARGRKDYCLKAPFSKVLEVVEGMDGVVIPSRLDKTPYRQLAIPALVEEYGIHAFDLVYPENPEVFEKHWPSGGFTFFSFSNAHALAQIGSRARKVKLPSPGFQGLKELVKRRPA